MRWEDERYIKLYTRDTLTWKRLGWEGRAVFPQLMRKVDRAGLLDIEELEPWEALAVVIEAPESLIRPAWESMLAAGVVTIRDTPSRAIFVPNFMHAQEAVQSDKARQRKHRELARLGESVTPRDERSRDVTNGHAESRGVTPSLAVPSQADLRGNKEGGEPEEAPAQPLNAGSSREPLKLIPDEPLTPLLAYLAAEFPQAKARPENEKAWALAFPGIDLLAEAKKARRWELDNPREVKIQKRRFLGNWFTNAQDRARPSPQYSRPATGPRPNAPVPPDSREAHLAEAAAEEAVRNQRSTR